MNTSLHYSHLLAGVCTFALTVHTQALEPAPAQPPAQKPPGIETAEFGKTKDGTPVKLLTLRNKNGMSVQIITYGAIIKEVQVPDAKGKFANVVLTADSMEKYEKFGGSAAVIGRVANRIAGAQFELQGQTYKLADNNNGNTIHGGRKGFAQRVWSVSGAGVPDAPGVSRVTLSYTSPDGEEGFPGTLKTSVTYSLTDKNELGIKYTAKTDKPTIVNLTNHAYWNLAGAGSGTALDHELWIPSHQYTPTDAKMIPTGEILPLKGTPMDFNIHTRIGERLDQLKPKLNGYDHNFLLAGPEKTTELRPAAHLKDPKSGRMMDVSTTQPAVQLYTANHLGHTAVCLETQHYPDAIHHKNFPSIVVKPGEPLVQETVHRFSVMDGAH